MIILISITTIIIIIIIIISARANNDDDGRTSSQNAREAFGTLHGFLQDGHTSSHDDDGQT